MVSASGIPSAPVPVDGFYYLALYAGSVPQGNDHDTAGRIKLRQLLFTDKALYDNAVSRLLKSFDLIRNLRAYYIKVYLRMFFPDQRENLLCEPQHRICIGRMGKAAYKEKSFPLCEILASTST